MVLDHDLWVFEKVMGQGEAPRLTVQLPLYLASDLASFTTGTVVVADAGQTAH